MKYIFIVEKTNTGYSAYAENANVATVGDTYAELKENMLEALNMLLEEEQKPLLTFLLLFSFPSFSLHLLWLCAGCIKYRI